MPRHGDGGRFILGLWRRLIFLPAGTPIFLFCFCLSAQIDSFAVLARRRPVSVHGWLLIRRYQHT